MSVSCHTMTYFLYKYIVSGGIYERKMCFDTPGTDITSRAMSIPYSFRNPVLYELVADINGMTSCML